MGKHKSFSSPKCQKNACTPTYSLLYIAMQILVLLALYFKYLSLRFQIFLIVWLFGKYFNFSNHLLLGKMLKRLYTNNCICVHHTTICVTVYQSGTTEQKLPWLELSTILKSVRRFAKFLFWCFLCSFGKGWRVILLSLNTRGTVTNHQRAT